MTRLYALNITELDIPSILPLLPLARQEKVQKLHKEADKARSAGAGWLLQYALEQAGIPREAQSFETSPLGKPFLKNHPHIHFSLSHSGQWAACAVGDAPLGVDVEQPRCTMEIAKRFFRPDELPETENKDFLLRLWTAKEAFVKAIGGGLIIPLDSFQVILRENEAVLEQDLSPLSYRLQEFSLEGHRICLCTTEEVKKLEIKTAPLEGSC